MALCSYARRFAEDLERAGVVVEKQRVNERYGCEGSLGGMAVSSLVCLRHVREQIDGRIEG